jgi:hypothetical protein
LQITVAGELVILDQGDAYTFPASMQHAFRVTPAAGRTQVLWVFSPALPDTSPGGRMDPPQQANGRN